MMNAMKHEQAETQVLSQIQNVLGSKELVRCSYKIDVEKGE
jgi:hypothetical protein